MSLHKVPLFYYIELSKDHGVFWISDCFKTASLACLDYYHTIYLHCRITIKFDNTRSSVEYRYECTHVTLFNFQTTRTRTWTPRTEVPWPTVTQWPGAAQRRTGTSPADSIWPPTWELIVSNNRPLALTMECHVFCWSSTRYNLIHKDKIVHAKNDLMSYLDCWSYEIFDLKDFPIYVL